MLISSNYIRIKDVFVLFKSVLIIKATPHKARQKTLHVINLQIFRHITHNFLTIRQYAFKNSMQSDEKYICVSAAQALCGIAQEIKKGDFFNVTKTCYTADFKTQTACCYAYFALYYNNGICFDKQIMLKQ